MIIDKTKELECSIDANIRNLETLAKQGIEIQEFSKAAKEYSIASSLPEYFKISNGATKTIEYMDKTMQIIERYFSKKTYLHDEKITCAGDMLYIRQK
jgi:hypothetical protein